VSLKTLHKTPLIENKVKDNESKHNVKFMCAYIDEDGTVYVTQGWGLVLLL